MCHVKRRRIETQCVLLFLLCLVLPHAGFTTNDCDLTIRSTNGGNKTGTFHSPNYPENYDNGLRCVYKFIALPNERVKIKFNFFQVKGVPPRCLHDYLDIFTRVQRPNQDLLDVPLHGRYCGQDKEILPHLLITMGNIFVLGFYTDKDKADAGFLGEYSFIDASPYNVGTLAPPDVCGQTIKSEQRPRGVLLSPTYPGMYPDNIFCFYKLQGQAGQRIRFKFIDLDLYSGGEHCPFDHVKIYDGYTNQAETIGIYCGRHKNLELFSTAEALHIEFVTKSGRVEPTKKPYVPYWEIEEDYNIQRKGFKAEFEISSDFVKLDFITEGHHVRGTECDQRVLSTGESNGTITSPGFPDRYPLNVTCRYYVDGLVDRQNLEKARLTFDRFDIPIVKERCDNGYIHAYLRGQDVTSDGPDRVFCGTILPNMLVTTNPRLFLIFDTHGSCTGGGFRAHYQFVTDYAIPGTPATDAKCHFIYNSDHRKSGTFNSPRHPSNYPHNTVCIYEFHGLKMEQIRITFENFMVENRYKNCSTDVLDIYSITATNAGVQNETLIGHFCGDKIPGPLVTEEDAHFLKLVFRTDGADFDSGFRAKYEYIEKRPFSKRCFMNITRGGGGLIHSPNHPHKYLINTTCEWHIYSRYPQGRILLQLVSFSMEGSLQQSGCANAVLKVYTHTSGIPTYELCGQDAGLTQIVSTDSYMRIRFISSARAVGAKGFRISWTELLPHTGELCAGFRCKTSKHCIDSSLKCNNNPNCGDNDSSDEDLKCPSYSDHGVLHVSLGVVITLVLLVFILVCVLHRRRKVRKKKNKQEIEVRYVTRGAAIARDRDNMDGGPRTDQLLLKERTEKVSIV